MSNEDIRHHQSNGRRYSTAVYQHGYPSSATNSTNSSASSRSSGSTHASSTTSTGDRFPYAKDYTNDISRLDSIVEINQYRPNPSTDEPWAQHWKSYRGFGEHYGQRNSGRQSGDDTNNHTLMDLRVMKASSVPERHDGSLKTSTISEKLVREAFLQDVEPAFNGDANNDLIWIRAEQNRNMDLRVEKASSVPDRHDGLLKASTISEKLVREVFLQDVEPAFNGDANNHLSWIRAEQNRNTDTSDTKTKARVTQPITANQAILWGSDEVERAYDDSKPVLAKEATPDERGLGHTDECEGLSGVSERIDSSAEVEELSDEMELMSMSSSSNGDSDFCPFEEGSQLYLVVQNVATRLVHYHHLASSPAWERCRLCQGTGNGLELLYGDGCRQKSADAVEESRNSVTGGNMSLPSRERINTWAAAGASAPRSDPETASDTATKATTISLEQSGPRRRRQRYEREDDDREKDQGGKRRKPSTPCSQADMSRRLACHYWKFNPIVHKDCAKLNLQDVSRIKQHLKRNHYHDYYCDDCWETFPTQNKYRQHRDHRSCHRQADQHRFMTHQQSNQLSKSSRRYLSETEKWFAVWDMLFPDHRQPESPDIDSTLSAELNSFREFVRTRGRLVFSDTLRSMLPETHWTYIDPIVDQAIPQALDMIVEQWTAENTNMGPSSSPASRDYSNTRAQQSSSTSL